MSQHLIQQYLNDLSDLRKASGSNRESIVSEAFKDLLKGYAKSHDLIFIPQYELPRQDGNRRIVDGALVYKLGLPFGYWEAKDEADDIDKEIAAKLRRGYPRDNIIFEDSRTAVLMQQGNEVVRCPVDDTDRLQHLLGLFFKFESPEIANFRKAVDEFQHFLPAILKDLRAMIEAEHTANAAFRKGAAKFLKHAQDTINPAVTADDVREMLIQHILTEEIFSKVFDEDDFHRQNNVAKELYALEGLFFIGALKKTTLRGLDRYYNAIRTTAHQIVTHTEKQTFLKVIYEGFYKVYNKKAADRLGVVYTPNEIVKFMIESADWLCQKHFGKALIDKGVEILDPATGTGTFICELMEHFRGQKQKLAWKYKEELHANEVAILPYYVANLNIEATYAAITGQYAEFPNLCFVDTLDNVAGLGKFSGHQEDMFGSVSEENVARIKRQNQRKISVIIGNPPYNANQQNENDNNKNRTYPRIDQRIKASYIKESTAQKTKAYDMYTRFFRWASDRLKDEGIVAFITNRSFIDSRTMDGFRKIAARDFAEVWIVDLGGDVRANPKLSGTKNNVFGIQTGVAISFLIRRKGSDGQCRIFYARRPEMDTAEAKLEFLDGTRLSELEVEEIQPDAKENWINQTDNDFESLVALADKKTKSAKTQNQERALFKIISLGIATNRDDWAYSETDDILEDKIEYFSTAFNRQAKAPSKTKFADFDMTIKWTSELESSARARKSIKFTPSKIVSALYRPFVRRKLYSDPLVVHRRYAQNEMFPKLANNQNPCINFRCIDSSHGLSTLSANTVADLCLLKQGNGGTFSVARYRYAADGSRIYNITDWALEQFNAHYPPPPQVHHQGRHLPLRLRRAARSHLPRKICAESEARISAHSVLCRLLAMGGMGRGVDGAAHRL